MADKAEQRRAFLRSVAGATLGAAAAIVAHGDDAHARSMGPDRRQQVAACGRTVVNPEAGGGCMSLALRRRVAEGGTPVTNDITCSTCGIVLDPVQLATETADEGYGPGIRVVKPVSRDIPTGD